MFSAEEIRSVTQKAEFKADLALVRDGLGKTRFGQQQMFGTAAVARLSHVVECVLASAPEWQQPDQDICRMAAEIAEILATVSPDSAHVRLRAAMLYELADLPAISQSLVSSNGLPTALKQFLGRSGSFSSLGHRFDEQDLNEPIPDLEHVSELAVDSDIQMLADFMQTDMARLPEKLAAELMSEVAAGVNLPYSATDWRALNAVFWKRTSSATRSNIGQDLLEALEGTQFPVELRPFQVSAIRNGLLDPAVTSWGLAAPTGTGKTFITQLLIADSLRNFPDQKVLYLAPSRALVHEVSQKLSAFLTPLAYKVLAVTPQLLELDQAEGTAVEEASVVVLTPEKADMLLRLGLDVFKELSLVIVDEAHHLESSTRGILLEMYLWRLKALINDSCRFVFLSAVAPNIGDVAAWMRGASRSFVFNRRPTRMRAGVYKIEGSGRSKRGVIEYTDGLILPIVGSPGTGVRNQLVRLCEAVAPAGPILVVAKGKGECETLANLMLESATTNAASSPEGTHEQIERLDSHLEREMYADVSLRKLVRKGIAYHHAGLPPRVRVALEEAIRQNLIQYVFATTTLAEGVNFPFATVIVQSLALREPPQAGRPGGRYQPVTPRVFWNLAGRAGRPGFDKEGQVILFEPTLGLDKISYVLGDYLNPELTAVQPVESALAASVIDIDEAVSSGELDLDQLGATSLPPNVSRRIRGAINLIRVSMLHARATRLVASYEDILDGTFANTRLSPDRKQTASRLFQLQDKVVAEFLTEPNAPSVELAAELGLSIETLSELRRWVSSLEDWQIANVHLAFLGGQINFEQAKYLIGPIAKYMAELEGPTLGGFLSEVIMQWLAGVPFASLRANLTGVLRDNSIEDLIALIYSRVQFLLPWGLYAADKLIENEANARRISYLNELKSIAYLVDAGVSNFDAMRLVHLQFERTDAQRLAQAYRRAGGLRMGVDIVAWINSQRLETIKTILRGTDNRRLDFDLEQRLADSRTQVRS